ncbi:alpha/beta hydrolase [bacterium]|nr:alpha/beta hydrolase [bacterium]
MEKETGYTDLDGTNLYYEITGSGPTLVLIHGFALDSRLWDPQFKEFSKNIRVLRYDMRGFGKSDLSAGEPYSHSKDLKTLLDHLNISKAYILGLSLGGMVATDFILQYPEMVDALITVDSTLGGYNLVEFGKSFEGVVELAFSSGIDKAKVLFGSLDIFKSASMIPDVANQLWNILTDYSGWHFINENPAISLEPPSIQQLKNIDTPTLILVGEFDSAEFHEVSNLLHEQIKDSRKEVLSGVGHVSNLENPEQFNNMVLKFLTDL